MQKYVSHKVVEAFKVVRMDGQPGIQILHGEPDADGNPVEVRVTIDWVMQKAISSGHEVVGGYFIQYPDGYQSWSPAKVFEEGYTPVELPDPDYEPEKQA